MANVITLKRIETSSPTRQRVMGILFLVLGLTIWFVFGRSAEPGSTASFGLVPGGSRQQLPPWIVTVAPTLTFLAIASVLAGGFQLARGFKRWTNVALGMVVFIFIFSFLVSAAAGKSLNLGGLLATTLVKSVPLTLGALAGILSERAGVVNIAIEGMMLVSAQVSCLVASVTGNLWIGLISGVLAGFLLAILHGILSIKYRTNQIISGTVINILAIGLTSYISSKFMQTIPVLNNSGTFKPWPVPVLVDIPIIGPILFNNNIFVYAMFIFLVVIHVSLFYTRWGLRLRSVGEHPKAADTLGIDVFKTRYMAVILGGMMAGFAGAYFTLGSVGRFDEVMTAGRGFIALAAMIFGNWMPFGALGAGLLFGFADALATRLTILGIPIPSEIMLMIPYLATMIVLAGVVGRAQAPAADGIPYEKE
jgi:simple sugar transport system permease protein